MFRREMFKILTDQNSSLKAEIQAHLKELGEKYQLWGNTTLVIIAKLLTKAVEEKDILGVDQIRQAVLLDGRGTFLTEKLLALDVSFNKNDIEEIQVLNKEAATLMTMKLYGVKARL